MSDPRVRRLGPGDHDAFLSGYEHAFDRRFPRELADWKYRRSPHGEAVLVGAETADGLVGGYALLPRRYRIAGAERLAFQRCDAWVDPDHRRRGIYTALLARCREEASADGAAFLFGFPNPLSSAAQARDGGATEVPLVRSVALLASTGVPGWKGLLLRALSRARRSRALDEAPGFTLREAGPDDLDRRIAAPDDADAIAPVADADWWRWRYPDAPGGAATVLAVDRAGVPVLTVALLARGSVHLILDLNGPGDTAAEATALRLVLGWCRGKGAGRVIGEGRFSLDLGALFPLAGFLQHPNPRSMTVHPLAGFTPPAAPDSWRVTLGDSDVVGGGS